MLTAPPMTRNLGCFAVSRSKGQGLKMQVLQVPWQKIPERQFVLQNREQHNCIDVVLTVLLFNIIIFPTHIDIGYYWLSGVPGDGPNNSDGVMGTKTWLWGETSGGVGGGGPGGVPGCTRKGLRERSRPRSNISGGCDDGSRGVGNAQRDLTTRSNGMHAALSNANLDSKWKGETKV